MAGKRSILFSKSSGLSTEELIRKRTFWSFFIFFALAAAGFGAWTLLQRQPSLNGVPKPFTAVMRFNESIFSKTLSDKHLAKEYPVSEAVSNVRVNGDLGMNDQFDPSHWVLNVVRKQGDTLHITLDQIKKLPKTDIVFNFKCIEGWSQITHWGGVKFSTFMRAFGLNDETGLKYVGLSTPDKEYYVGIDMPSALHPQTLLCYEMNGVALPMNQGYPLRLIIPVKYGVKNIKRIGTMQFSDSRPPDYWSDKKGYDYFSGL